MFDGKNEESKQKGGVQLILLGIYLTIFIWLILLQLRGLESFQLVKSNLNEPIFDTEWINYPPLRMMRFAKLQSLEDTYSWAQESLVGKLYGNGECIVVKDDINQTALAEAASAEAEAGGDGDDGDGDGDDSTVSKKNDKLNRDTCD